MSSIEVKTSPAWRIVEILAGIIVLILAVIVLAEPGFAVLTLTVVIAGALIIGGLSRIILGVFATVFPVRMRQSNIIGGIMAFILGIVGIIFLENAVATLILILALAILVIGFGEIGVAFSRRPVTWHRILIAIVGFLIIVLGIYVVLDMNVGQGILAAILAIALVFLGIRDIVHGVTGHKPVSLPPTTPVTEV
jgi:uncharacterized membrane protein HdeD (DUF308 family)